MRPEKADIIALSCRISNARPMCRSIEARGDLHMLLCLDAVRPPAISDLDGRARVVVLDGGEDGLDMLGHAQNWAQRRSSRRRPLLVPVDVRRSASARCRPELP